MGEISSWGVAVSGVLVLVAVGISAWKHLGLERSLVVAALRALVQLAAMGLVLQALIAPGRPLALSWLWVVVMIGFAAWTVRRRAPEVPGAGWLAALAFSLAAVVTLGVLLGLGVFPAEGRTVVPLAGLMIGNSMNATVLAARRLVEELRDKRLEVEARLSLGQPATVAAQPYLRSVVRTALIPQVETTKAVGIVFLPGAMVGLLLAGVDPLEAIRVQIAVMYLVLGSTAVSATTVAIGLSKRLFTSDHRLVPLARPAD